MVNEIEYDIINYLFESNLYDLKTTFNWLYSRWLKHVVCDNNAFGVLGKQIF